MLAAAARLKSHFYYLLSPSSVAADGLLLRCIVGSSFEGFEVMLFYGGKEDAY